MSRSNDLPPLRPWVPIDRIGSAKIGPKGQIVIPKAMRDRVGMKPGGKVFIDQDGAGVITLRFAWNDTISGPPDYLAKFPVLPGMEGKTSLDILHEMDAEDEEIDERQYQRWIGSAASFSTPNPSSATSGGKPLVHGSKTSSGRRKRAPSPSP